MSLPYPRELMRSLEFSAELCNRRREGLLTTAASLRDLCATWTFPGAGALSKADADATWSHLGTIEALWDQDRDAVAVMVNRIFSEAGARPHLVRHDGLDWHLHGLPAEAPIADAIVVNAAMAFIDLVRADDTARCKRCGDDRCERMFFDQSRNRSRRFCSTTCQSRTNVAAFRARHS
ncbi:CGNR zinc finger domain-containing protein [Agrococcus sp. DT81.2]|uniref:CGNR zinc finger domain-containing protein n=1 Tax=Agrococcus sp. DT81.2 TaxID=3393414 RepID=UPI003CE4D882